MWWKTYFHIYHHSIKSLYFQNFSVMKRPNFLFLKCDEISCFYNFQSIEKLHFRKCWNIVNIKFQKTWKLMNYYISMYFHFFEKTDFLSPPEIYRNINFTLNLQPSKFIFSPSVLWWSLSEDVSPNFFGVHFSKKRKFLIMTS